MRLLARISIVVLLVGAGTACSPSNAGGINKMMNSVPPGKPAWRAMKTAKQE